MTIGLRAAIQSLLILVAFGVLAFVPAGTFDYWQAWLFLAVFTIATLVSCGYLMVKDPAALARRMHAGPAAETRPGAEDRRLRRALVDAGAADVQRSRSSLRVVAGAGRHIRARRRAAILLPGFIGFAVRILDEEQMLSQELDGYREYSRHVHRRLVPYLW